MAIKTYGGAKPIFRVSEYTERKFYISIANAVGSLSYIGTDGIPINATELLKGKNWIKTRREAEALMARLINPTAIRIGGE